MKAFHEWIREGRKRLGFATAKEFHRQKKIALSMSYESYANIEAGKYLPPAEKLIGLVEALEIEEIRGFLYSYCWTLMPNDLFKGFFSSENKNGGSRILMNDSYTTYKEKFHALLEFNRLQTKYELGTEQIQYLETDLVAWDIINLFISCGDEGFTLNEIAEKTDSGIESTTKRVQELSRVGMLKRLENGKYLVTQDAFIIPRKAVGDRLTHLLVRRELEQCYRDDRNRPYTRFRFMSIDPDDRENFEMFIDNFILDSRRFKKSGGKTHYLQILFSDRNDLL
ncbi:MAG: helix-turn-helix transcriptional regulator [Bdellovibrionota bacterium]